MPTRFSTPLRRIAIPVCLGLLVACPSASAQSAARARSPEARPGAPVSQLTALDAAIQDLATRVAESVVQVIVTGYGPLGDDGGANADVVIAPQRGIGSGAIIDSDGYIVTNAHVVAGAKRVQVVLHTANAAVGGIGALAAGAGRTVNAQVIGQDKGLDLALLKVDATGLRPLPLADYDAVRQGQLVFAFGSPEGLRNSLSMGVVSAVARQPDLDHPAVFIQTDAPINAGNSGGPLVNVSGEMVGLNTFIISKSGGSQGLGFAIPSAVVAAAYPQLRRYGHLNRGILGVSLQAITPPLAAGLRLSRVSGVLVSDVLPDGPADLAGLHVGDIVTSVNGRVVDNVPMVSLELGLAETGEPVTLGVVRGESTLSVPVRVTFRPDPLADAAMLTDPETNGVPVLGIIGVDVTAIPSLQAGLRVDSGVLVTAKIQNGMGNLVPLAVGDVIHAVDTIPVRSLAALRVLLDDRPDNSDVVLQVERGGQLLFVTCEIN